MMIFQPMTLAQARGALARHSLRQRADLQTPIGSLLCGLRALRLNKDVSARQRLKQLLEEDVDYLEYLI